jgi:hypothetical protein
MIGYGRSRKSGHVCELTRERLEFLRTISPIPRQLKRRRFDSAGFNAVSEVRELP